MVPELMKILVIDDDYAIRDASQQILSRNGCEVVLADMGHTGLELFETNTIDLVVLDMKLPDMDGISVLETIRRYHSEIPVVVITAFPTVECAVRVMKMGAYDYIPKPFTPNLLRTTVAKALEKSHLETVKQQGNQGIQTVKGLDAIVGISPAIIELKQFVRRAGMSDCSVLITGETGTGKELVARALHDCSRKRNNNFITVDSGGIAETLVESELFGHVRGAFTGAYTDRVGRFEMAHQGTLFFDEIANMTYRVQSKLLRVLQEHEFSRVGSSRSIEVNVRIIAATNRDLLTEIELGNFREDLYYRLNIISIHLPPLRERAIDIPVLADYFLAMFRTQKGSVFPERISEKALQKMTSHTWPGNVRELKNLIERAVALCDEREVDPFEIVGGEKSGFRNADVTKRSAVQLEEIEREHIEKVLRNCRYNKTKAAETLGIDRKTLRHKMRKFQIPE